MILDHYGKIVSDAYSGYWDYLWKSVTIPSWTNYFYWLTGISIFFFLLEITLPWRMKQATFRKDFWLDLFYVYFNYFLFSLIIFNALSNLAVDLFQGGLGLLGINNLVAIQLRTWPAWSQMVLLLIVADFLQWNIHRLLHRVPFLWEFHKVHHSVEQMGFAAHLRYHWMENVVYKGLLYLPLAMIGFSVGDFFIVYMFQTFVGHWNHANFTMDIGPLRYVFNHPAMHIWHHSHELPEKQPYGINFGLTLSIWDYLFGTAWVPKNGRDIRLGFPKLESFPKNFFAQIIYGFGRRHWRKK